MIQNPSNMKIVGEVSEAHNHFDVADASVRSTLFESQRHHFWFSSRNALIGLMMKRIGLAAPARVLDVGCGTGTVLVHLSKVGYRIDGIEMHRSLGAEAARTCPQSKVYCLEVMRDGVEALGTQYEGIGLFDVLEHTDDPSAFLRVIRGALRSDGIVFGTVPALQSLWSTLDTVSGHQRRYDRAELNSDLRDAGLTPILTAYFFQSLAPMIRLHRRSFRKTGVAETMSRAEVIARCLAPPPRVVNTMLRGICFVERLIHRCLPSCGRFPGASLFFAARASAASASLAQ